MIVSVLLICICVLFILGAFYLLINIVKLNKNQIPKAKKQDFPLYLKRSLIFLAGAFLLLAITNLF